MEKTSVSQEVTFGRLENVYLSNEWNTCFQIMLYPVLFHEQEGMFVSCNVRNKNTLCWDDILC